MSGFLHRVASGCVESQPPRGTRQNPAAADNQATVTEGLVPPVSDAPEAVRVPVTVESNDTV